MSGDDEKTCPGRPPPPPGGYVAWALENVALSMSRASGSLNALSGELRRLGQGQLTPVQVEQVCAQLRDLGYEMQAAAAVLDGRRNPPVAQSRLR